MKTTVLALMMAGLVAGGCAKKVEEEASAPSQPTYGNICAAGTSNRIIIPRQDGTGDPGGYIEAATGTTISSISFRNLSTLNGSYGTFIFQINVRGCDFTSASLGTASASVSGMSPSAYKTLTFNFSPAITIPTNCASGKKTITFKIAAGTSMSAGDQITADVGTFSTASCPTQNTQPSASGLGTAESGKAWATTVVAQ